MNSDYLQEYEANLKRLAGTDQIIVDGILKQSFQCFVTLISRAVEGIAIPEGDLLQLTVQLLLISDGLSRLDEDSEDTRSAHYLVGLGFEQSSELLTRAFANLSQSEIPTPLTDDVWYRLVLAFLHYSAAGYRIQAKTVARHLEDIARNRSQLNADTNLLYQEAIDALGRIRDALPPPERVYPFAIRNWESILFGEEELPERNLMKFRLLARQVQKRRLDLLERLGYTPSETDDWLSSRSVELTENSVKFWHAYLKNLKRRGYTAFTPSQEGPGFDKWLTLDTNLLAILPTGGGKTIIGELRTALTLASGFQVVWLLPTRPLVRQVKTTLISAFDDLDVDIEELPPTDTLLTFENIDLTQDKSVAVTTPERLHNLLRGNPGAISQVRLVVVDEAQVLTEPGRAAAIESVLSQMRSQIPDCRFVFLSSAFEQAKQLKNFLQRLGESEPTEINDSQRPTRRLCGVLTTDQYFDSKYYPSILLYPPQPIKSVVNKQNAYRIFLNKKDVKREKPCTDLAGIFARQASKAGLRTIFFAASKPSTETQARKLATKTKQPKQIPIADSDRLQIELGRPSQIQALAVSGVGCHHADMMPIEQQMVERWLIEGLIHTVTATPTLAQGVNLPFDISILSHLTRFNPESGRSENLTQHEVQNMLGRAGRAGFVSDGISLLAIQRKKENDPIYLLNKHRNTFFGQLDNTNKVIGVRRTLENAIVAHASNATWLDELHGLAFSDSQSLVSLVCTAIGDSSDSQTVHLDYLNRLPSVREVTEKDPAKTKQYLELIESISTQLVSRFGSDDSIKNAVSKTGFPVELIRFYIQELRKTPSLRDLSLSEQLAWYDAIVLEGITTNQSRHWCKVLLGEHDLATIYSAILQWRSGQPILPIEQILFSSKSKQDSDNNRRRTVEFIRQKIPMLAQFWNALAVCDVELYGEFDTFESPSTFHVLVREGVSSIQHSMWLHQLGGLDRVLSGSIAKIFDLPSKPREARKAIRRRLHEWGGNDSLISQVGLGQYLLPIKALLKENRFLK